MKSKIDAILKGLREELAALEHERWSHWQSYMHEQAERQTDGSLVIPTDLVNRWERQLKTSYRNLTEKEKDSDREQVDRYLPIIRNALADFYNEETKNNL